MFVTVHFSVGTESSKKLSEEDLKYLMIKVSVAHADIYLLESGSYDINVYFKKCWASSNSCHFSLLCWTAMLGRSRAAIHFNVMTGFSRNDF